MAYFQLTEAMILTSFEETGIDEKYYPIYAKIAKRFFEDLSKEGSNEDGQTEEDNYAISSLNLADEYITYYAKEAERAIVNNGVILLQIKARTIIGRIMMPMTS